MKIESKLARLFEVIVEELKTNEQFAMKLKGVLDGDEQEPHQASNDRGGEKNGNVSSVDPVEHAVASPPGTTSKRRTRKRNPALFNPETLLESSGEGKLLESLNYLNVDQLKDIISEFGMDPGKRVSRCRKKEKFVTHIMEVARNRLEKGKAFRTFR